MDWRVFLTTFGVIFLAEMGDKTQLVALLFATRYKAITVLFGVFAATFLVSRWRDAIRAGQKARDQEYAKWS